jgi:hypothetical protein
MCGVQSAAAASKRKELSMTFRIKHWMWTALAALTLAGCGGGATISIGNPPPQEDPPAGQIVISSGNAREAAAEGVNLALEGLNAGLGDAWGRVDAQGVSPGLGKLALSALRRGLDTRAAAAPAAIDATRDIDCDSGKLRVVITASGTELAAGDSIALAFSDCVENGVTTHGVVRYRLTSLTGDLLGGGAFSLAASVGFENLSMLRNGSGVRVNGSANVVINHTDAGHFSIGMNGTTLGMDRYLAGSIVASRALGNFRSNETVFGSTRSVSVLGTVSGNFPRLGVNRNFDLQTLVPLVADAAARYPKSGQLKVLGSGGTSATLTVIDSASVKLEFDTNGDGTAEGSTTLTWVELLAFL